MLKIMLDPGHGAGERHNRGFKQVENYSYCNEGDCNYIYAKYYFKPALEKYGIRVGLTRNKIDDNPSFWERGRMAAGYDILISCHSNAASSEEASGTEVWDSTNPVESIKELTDKICESVSDFLEIPNRGTRYRKLANNTNYFGILRHGLAKHNFIVEHCFHTNISDATKYRKNLAGVADAEAQAIAEYFGLVKTKPKKKEKKKKEEKKVDAKARYLTQGKIKIIETTADNIYLQQMQGKTLAQVGAVGINGTFFNTPYPELPESTWSISVNHGAIIGPNAGMNHPNRNIKRATMIYADDKVFVVRINNLGELKRKISDIDWAVGGVGIYPSYDPYEEKVPGDILRTAAHTWIGYKGNTVYLCVAGHISIKEIINWAKVNTDGCVLLDGGGSSQMFWLTGPKLHSKRKLNSIIGVKRI